MTSGYAVSLSGPFRTSVILNKEDAMFWTLFLIENESSFAVTVGTPYTLWLSDESCRAMTQKLEELNKEPQ